MAQFILIGMCIGIKMSTISPLFTSKCQHGQYRTLKVEYLSSMPVFTKIIVLYNFRYKKLSKPSMYTIIKIKYKQPVPYLPVNASMDNTYFKSGVFPMPAFTKSTSFQTLETYKTMYITIKQIPWHSLY